MRNFFFVLCAAVVIAIAVGIGVGFGVQWAGLTDHATLSIGDDTLRGSVLAAALGGLAAVAVIIVATVVMLALASVAIVVPIALVIALFATVVGLSPVLVPVLLVVGVCVLLSRRHRSAASHATTDASPTLS